MKRGHHTQRSGHLEMGTCPICETTITTAQDTTWKLVDDVPARIHARCSSA